MPSPKDVRIGICKRGRGGRLHRGPSSRPDREYAINASRDQEETLSRRNTQWDREAFSANGTIAGRKTPPSIGRRSCGGREAVLSNDDSVEAEGAELTLIGTNHSRNSR